MNIRKPSSALVRDALQLLFTHPSIVSEVAQGLLQGSRMPDWRDGGHARWLARNDVLILRLLNTPDKTDMNWLPTHKRLRYVMRMRGLNDVVKAVPEGINYFHQRINKNHVLAERIKACAHEGKVRVVESGRDCDGVEYSGGSGREIAANLMAFKALERDVAQWADGPFALSVVPWDFNEPYESRDLVMEAHENGHPHSIVSRFR